MISRSHKFYNIIECLQKIRTGALVIFGVIFCILVLDFVFSFYLVLIEKEYISLLILYVGLGIVIFSILTMSATLIIEYCLNKKINQEELLDEFMDKFESVVKKKVPKRILPI